MFDKDGNVLDAIQRAARGRAGRLSCASCSTAPTRGQRQRFRELGTQLGAGLDLQGQSSLVLNSRLIEWLLRTVPPGESERLLGINNLMKLELQQAAARDVGSGPRPTGRAVRHPR